MTKTKLPEIGKRYKHKFSGEERVVKGFDMTAWGETIEFEPVSFNKVTDAYACHWEDWEELPPEEPVVKESLSAGESKFTTIRVDCPQCGKSKDCLCWDEVPENEKIEVGAGITSDSVGNENHSVGNEIKSVDKEVEVAIEELIEGLECFVNSLKSKDVIKNKDKERLKSWARSTLECCKLDFFFALDEQSKSKTSEKTNKDLLEKEPEFVRRMEAVTANEKIPDLFGKIDFKQGSYDAVREREELINYIKKQLDKQKDREGCETENEEEKPLWKPVSELPENDCEILIRKKDSDGQEHCLMWQWQHKFKDFASSQGLPQGTYAFCSFLDFINDHESLKSKVKALEKKVERLINAFQKSDSNK